MNRGDRRKLFDLAEAAIDYRDHVASVAVERAGESRDRFQDSGGTIVTLSPEEIDAWAAGMPNIAKDWAAGLEEQGLPGDAILAAYMDIMRENGQPNSRQWDQE